MRTAIFPLLFTFALASCGGDLPTGPSTTPAAPDRAAFPDVIALPNGFGADGIAFGAGSTLYVGSYSSGAIWKGDARTGAGSLLVTSQTGRSACAVKYDARTNRLFAAGSFMGQAYVYDAGTGATRAVYQLANPADGPTAILDVAVLRDAVYFTDVLRPVLYRLPLAADGSLPPQSAVEVLPYSGDYQFVPDGALNSTGIVSTPDDRWLIGVNATTGALYRIDPATARALAIDLGGASLPSADGLVLAGHTLYASQVAFNRIAVVRLDDDFTRGVVEQQTLDNAALDSPSKIALFGSAVYASNARFETLPAPDVTFEVVRLSR